MQDNYYIYVSPERLYARIREEMSSYFNADMLNDLLFEEYTLDCLKEFEKTFFPKKRVFLQFENGLADLPCDYDSFREAVLYGADHIVTAIDPVPVYYMSDVPEQECSDPDGVPCLSECGCSCEGSCGDSCDARDRYLRRINHNIEIIKAYRKRLSQDDLEIDCGKIKLPCYSGALNLVYYAKPYDEDENILIPDNYFVQRYISAYITFSLYNRLWNEATDETFNQSYKKREVAKFEMEEARDDAMGNVKRSTTDSIIKSIRRQRKSLNKFRYK